MLRQHKSYLVEKQHVFSKFVSSLLVFYKDFYIFASVNQRVDIEKYLADFREEIGQLKGSVANLIEDNTRLNRRVEVQNVEIRILKTENADLKERLAKYEDPELPKNSNNSSIPPSKENMGDEIKRRTASL